ncbi:TPA: hypothetical protein DIC40_06450 [Patescibacteria group bacterium]|nr:hypothetical protein [Candidatus Gracilibacteria bacterium]
MMDQMEERGLIGPQD